MQQSAPIGRWGQSDPDHGGLDPRTLAFAESVLGPAAPSPLPHARPVPPSALGWLPESSSFTGVRVDVSDEARRQHARGMSYLDLLAWRTDGVLPGVPDAVAFPRDHEQVVTLLDACSREQIAVIPVGGGTSVTGGISAEGLERPVLAVSLSDMDRVLDVDTESGIATVEAGITGPQLEAALDGWTLGHFPQSWQRASIGGYIAARSSGQSSSGYGRIEDMLISARLATPVGTWEVGGYPAASQGPDLKHLVLGSEGTLGIVTSAQLRIRPAPTVREFSSAIVPGDFQAGVDLMKALTRLPLRPTILRVSDPAETTALLSMSTPTGITGRAFDAYVGLRKARPGNLVIVGWEGTDPSALRAARSLARDVLVDAEAVSLGQGPGRSWQRGRFHGPFLRDELMDQGYLVETFETVARWSLLPQLHGEVVSAARECLGERSYVMAHLSHSYDAGASVYFTVLAGGWNSPDSAAKRWRTAKATITEAIINAGGALSHHHGVGRDHAPWLPEQLGVIGVDVLRSIRATVDPRQVMNPGALLAEGG